MKILIVRFSSIGDVTQSLSIPNHCKNTYPHAQIHFLTKSEFKELMVDSPYIDKIWTIDSKENFTQLIHLAQQLSKENFTHIYDAHNNLRSNLFYRLIRAPHKLQKPMQRLFRFLLIQFKLNYFEKPFSGQRDLLKPLEKWNIPFALPNPPQLFLNSKTQFAAQKILDSNNITRFIVFVPSAAHPLKRWPISHWIKLIELNQHQNIIILAGPKDHFTSAFNHFPNVLNLTGQTSLIESAAIIEKATCIVTNDTGLLHFSEQLGKPTIALMGPAPFGFPSRSSTVIFEKKLKCRPCSKHGQGPCSNSIYQECMVTISAEDVSNQLGILC